MQGEELMNSPMSSIAGEKSPHVESQVEVEISKLVEQELPKLPQIRNNADRIRSSVARLTASSMEGLGGLTSELQELQQFLKSEVDRVQGDIEAALAGIKIIMETIAPWKSPPAPLAPPTTGRAIRSGPAANTASGSSTYGKTTL